MTIEEHMCLTYLLMNVRDELADHARRDPQTQEYVKDVETCLAILHGPSVRSGVTAPEERA